MLGGIAISCSSRMQRVVAMSTTEAEYMAATEVAKEIMFLRQVQLSMSPDMTEYYITIMEDNEGAVKMTKNPISTHRTKHIVVKFHFIRQLYQEDQIDILHVGTEDQRADMLTKALNE
ncbi:unnamed protein product, partial [Discosporangium mesarthrocarpum]